MRMIIATISLTVPSEKRIDVVQTLRSMVEPILAFPGCMECRLLGDINNDDALVFMQKWNSNDDLKRFIQSSGFLKTLVVLDLALEKPDISFFELSSVKGLEYVEALRKDL